MSHLATQLGYSIWEFQTLQLIVLATLVSWINRLPSTCWSTFWKSIFKQQLGCRFAIMDSISSFFYFDICNYICLDISYTFLALSLFLEYSLFFKYSCTNILHRRSPCTFYTDKFDPIFFFHFWTKLWLSLDLSDIQKQIVDNHFSLNHIYT